MHKAVLFAVLIFFVMPARTDAAPDQEALIREYQELARRKPAATAEYDRHLAAHPELLTASARPYGPTMMWLLEYEYSDGVLALLRAGAAIPSGALALAARGGMVDVMKRLLDGGARDDAQGLALQLAAKYGHVNALQLLIERGANLGARQENDGFTALHEAVIGRRVEAVRVLIAARAPLEARDRDGRTPLFWGVFAYAPKDKHIYQKIGGPHDTVRVDVGEAKAMELLIAAGARIDTVDKSGNTPLHEAAMLGSRRGAAVLMAHGAKVNVKNHEGKTPLALAKERNNLAIVEIMQGKR